MDRSNCRPPRFLFVQLKLDRSSNLWSLALPKRARGHYVWRDFPDLETRLDSLDNSLGDRYQKNTGDFSVVGMSMQSPIQLHTTVVPFIRRPILMVHCFETRKQLAARVLEQNDFVPEAVPIVIYVAGKGIS